MTVPPKKRPLALGSGSAWPAYTTTYGYDGLGRPTSVTTADGAVASTSYSGNTTTILDQALHKKTVTTDGLGRITQVAEDPAGLNIVTSYTWGANSTLQKVTQGTQNRIYGYDSAGRMTSANQPESGTVNYTYDSVGNQLSRSDARGRITCYGSLSGTTCNSGYDALNRPTQIAIPTARPL